MTHYIDKSVLIKKIEKRERMLDIDSPYGIGAMVELECLKDIIDHLEEKEVNLKDYHKLEKVLAISFMRFLDEKRPAHKMCLSDDECLDIDKAFHEMDFSKLFEYMKKYLNTQKIEI